MFRLMHKTYRRRRHKKKRCPRECRKKKAPSGGLGEMIVGSTVYVFVLLFLVSHKQAFGSVCGYPHGFRVHQPHRGVLMCPWIVLVAKG